MIWFFFKDISANSSSTARISFNNFEADFIEPAYYKPGLPISFKVSMTGSMTKRSDSKQRTYRKSRYEKKAELIFCFFLDFCQVRRWSSVEERKSRSQFTPKFWGFLQTVDWNRPKWLPGIHVRTEYLHEWVQNIFANRSSRNNLSQSIFLNILWT